MYLRVHQRSMCSVMLRMYLCAVCVHVYTCVCVCEVIVNVEQCVHVCVPSLISLLCREDFPTISGQICGILLVRHSPTACVVSTSMSYTCMSSSQGPHTHKHTHTHILMHVHKESGAHYTVESRDSKYSLT